MPPRAPSSVLETARMDVAAPHDFRHSKRTLGGLNECPSASKVDRELALWTEWADSEERKELCYRARYWNKGSWQSRAPSGTLKKRPRSERPWV